MSYQGDTPTTAEAKVLGLEGIKSEYENDKADFTDIYKGHGKGNYTKFYLHEGFLFKGPRLCIPQGSLRELLISEAHSGGLMGHFGIAKTLAVVRDYLYWPKMRRMVEKHCERCITCRKAKSRVNPHGLYMPLPISSVPCRYLHGLHDRFAQISTQGFGSSGSGSVFQDGTLHTMRRNE